MADHSKTWVSSFLDPLPLPQMDSLRRTKQLDSKPIDRAGRQAIGRRVVIAGVDDAVEIGALLLHGLDGAPQHPLPSAAVVGVRVEEPDGSLPARAAGGDARSEEESEGREEAGDQSPDEDGDRHRGGDGGPTLCSKNFSSLGEAEVREGGDGPVKESREMEKESIYVLWRMKRWARIEPRSGNLITDFLRNDDPKTTTETENKTKKKMMI